MEVVMRWGCLFVNTVLFFFAVLFFVFSDNKDVAFAAGVIILTNTAVLTEFDPEAPLKCVRLYFHRKILEEKARIAELKKTS